jgi:GcrA cell cycle regulator
MAFPWNDITLAAARRLFDSGRSAGLAAKELSADFEKVSRSAVSGKWFRMGLQRGGMPATAVVKKPRAVRTWPMREPRPRRASAANESDAEADNVVVLLADRKPLVQLGQDECRWPCGGDPSSEGFLFCGRRQTPGSPYCAPHDRIAHGRLRVRRRG